MAKAKYILEDDDEKLEDKNRNKFIAEWIG